MQGGVQPSLKYGFVWHLNLLIKQILPSIVAWSLSNSRPVYGVCRSVQEALQTYVCGFIGTLPYPAALENHFVLSSCILCVV